MRSAYLTSGDSDNCENGRWRAVDVRLLVINETLHATYTTFWGPVVCRGHWLSSVNMHIDSQMYVTVTKVRKLLAPRNSGVWMQKEFDAANGMIYIEGRLHSRLSKGDEHFHASGSPFMYMSKLWMLIHKHNRFGGKFRYGHGYRYKIVQFDPSTFRIEKISEEFCPSPCTDILFIMNTFLVGKVLHFAAGVDDCDSIVQPFPLDVRWHAL